MELLFVRIVIMRITNKQYENLPEYLKGYFLPYHKDKPTNASRFFYVAKASRAERTCNGQIENRHPTIKPLKLCEYLVLLTKTPNGGIILDPFCGSGTTCMAAKKIGRDFIGIEKENSYCKIAEARIKAIPQPLF